MADLSHIENNRIVQDIDANAAAVTAEVVAGRKKMNRFMLCCLPLAIIFMYFSPDTGATALIAMGGIWAFVYAAGGWRMSGSQTGDPMLRAGAMGELAVLEELKALPDDYILLNQICVPDPHSSVGYHEMDYVVVGPNGVHVLEAKSYKGHLSGSENDDQWQLLKVGRGGTPYISSCRNPVRQTRVYIRLLSQALKARGDRNWLNGLVVLARDNSLDEINVSSIGVVQLSGVVDYLMNFRGRDVKNPKAVAAVIRSISEEVKRG